MIQLARNDLPAYLRACWRMFDRIGVSDDPTNWNTIAWECSLEQGDNVPPDQIVALMDKAVAAKPKDYAYLNTRAAALYRAHRFDDAAKQLDDSMAAEGHGGGFEDWVYLAMAQFRLGQTDKARDSLKRAIALYDEGISPKDPKAAPLDWASRVEWRVYARSGETDRRGEAEIA